MPKHKQQTIIVEPAKKNRFQESVAKVRNLNLSLHKQQSEMKSILRPDAEEMVPFKSPRSLDADEPMESYRSLDKKRPAKRFNDVMLNWYEDTHIHVKLEEAKKQWCINMA
jgi:hypothetical protein